MNKLGNLGLKVVRFDSEDVIATSVYYVPMNIYYDDPAATGIRSFYASMGPYSDDAQGWLLTDTDFVSRGPWDYTSEVDYSKGEGANYAYGVYDAYKYNDAYYTKGASYYDIYGNSGS